MSQQTEPTITASAFALWLGDQLSEDFDAWEINIERPNVVRVTFHGQNFEVTVLRDGDVCDDSDPQEARRASELFKELEAELDDLNAVFDDTFESLITNGLSLTLLKHKLFLWLKRIEDHEETETP